MALIKKIELNNGITLNYHRIVSINKLTNHATILEIAGYTSKAKRLEEIEKLAAGESMNIYIRGDLIEVEYDEASTIKDWYAYLKTTDKYSGAEDDEDEEDKQVASTSDEPENVKE